MIRLKEILAEKGITQRELAQKSGLNEVFLSNLNRDDCNPTLQNLTKLAESLGVGICDLLGEKRKIYKTLKTADVSSQVKEGIKCIAKDLGMSLYDVADEMGCSYQNLNQSLSKNPTIETLSKIAKTLNCEVGDFFVRTEPWDEFNAFVIDNGKLRTFKSRKTLKEYVSTI